jgi:hypothetical protein
MKGAKGIYFKAMRGAASEKPQVAQYMFSQFGIMLQSAVARGYLEGNEHFAGRSFLTIQQPLGYYDGPSTEAFPFPTLCRCMAFVL